MNARDGQWSPVEATWMERVDKHKNIFMPNNRSLENGDIEGDEGDIEGENGDIEGDEGDARVF